MANGVLKSQAEYYQDSTTYTGDPGTSTNKYVIEDVYDLCSSELGASVHAELVADIDFNSHDTYKLGVSSTVIGKSGQNTSMASLDGRGHKIRNLVLKNLTTYAVSAYKVSNIVFENLVFMGTTSGKLFTNNSGNFNVSSKCAVDNVGIGCYMYDSSAAALFCCEGYKIATWANCSFNVNGKTTDGCNVRYASYDSSQKLDMCHINLDIQTVGGTCIDLGSYCSIKSSYFTGKIHQIGDAVSYFVDGGKFNNSYIAVSATNEVPDFSGYNMNFQEVSAASFVDTDLISVSEGQSPPTNMYYLTTSQAKDPDYLSSIGFPVVSV